MLNRSDEIIRRLASMLSSRWGGVLWPIDHTSTSFANVLCLFIWCAQVSNRVSTSKPKHERCHPHPTTRIYDLFSPHRRAHARTKVGIGATALHVAAVRGHEDSDAFERRDRSPRQGRQTWHRYQKKNKKSIKKK